MITDWWGWRPILPILQWRGRPVQKVGMKRWQWSIRIRPDKKTRRSLYWQLYWKMSGLTWVIPKTMESTWYSGPTAIHWSFFQGDCSGKRNGDRLLQLERRWGNGKFLQCSCIICSQWPSSLFPVFLVLTFLTFFIRWGLLADRMVCQLKVIGRLYGLPIRDYWQTVPKICKRSANLFLLADPWCSVQKSNYYRTVQNLRQCTCACHF